MRLPRSRNMRSRSEFLRVRKEGRSFGGRYLVLAALRAEEIATFRVAFVVPKRVGKAVHRNLLRRRLRAIVAEAVDALQPGHYLVTIARAGAAEQSYATLWKEWRWLAKRARLQRRFPPSGQPSTSAAAGSGPIAPDTAPPDPRHHHG